MLHRRLKGGDGRWYSPDRDLAYAMPCLARAALDQLEVENWDSEFRVHFERMGLNQIDLGQAAQALARYIAVCHRPDIKNPRAVLMAAGWFDCTPAAQMAVLMKLGQVHLCAFFSAVRDITPADDEKPPFDAEILYDAAFRATFQIRDRRWVRWVRRQVAYVKGLFRWHKPPPPGEPPVTLPGT